MLLLKENCVLVEGLGVVAVEEEGLGAEVVLDFVEYQVVVAEGSFEVWILLVLAGKDFDVALIMA